MSDRARCIACGFTVAERLRCRLTMDEEHRFPLPAVATETAEQQIARLARCIMDEVPGEPSLSEGAVDTAIRLLRAWKR